MSDQRRAFYEFFAGGGMARAGLGPGWRCLFANDCDPAKAAAYAANWGDAVLRVADVARLTATDIPERADLAWASFPCQDLSLAGGGLGLKGGRSGLFFAFAALMRDLGAQRRAPGLIAVENVIGLLTSHGGADFAALVERLDDLGYRVGAMAIDAARFTPQSRPRVFILAARADLTLPPGLTASEPTGWTTPAALLRAVDRLDAGTRARWLWWRLPEPPRRNAVLADLIEPAPAGVDWRTPAQTARLIDLMAPLHRARVAAALASGGRFVGALYRRTRPGPDGRPLQRAEVRFDGLAGCLRTPAGGSSRQTIVVVENGVVRSRLLSAREAARLMGLCDDYILPETYNGACHLLGDGVAAPVVAWLSRHLFEAIATGADRAAA